LDGLYAHLYGLTRDELAYILDTFPIVRRKDEEQWREYRTKRLVLEAYEEQKHTFELIDRLVELEADVHYQKLPSDDEPEFHYVPGQVPILLSAPHGAVHVRNERPKKEDEYTAGLARLVAQLTSAHVLYARRRSDTDPNSDPNAPYREHLREIVGAAGIRFVLDIHGASAQRDFGIALGTLSGESCPVHQDTVVKVFEEHGFTANGSGLNRLALNPPGFAGGETQATITRYVSKDLRVPAAQVELNAYLRIPKRRADATLKEPFYGNIERIGRAIDALVAIVQALAS